MHDMPTAHDVRRAGGWADAWDRCTLTYDERFLRRKVLHTVTESAFLVDLAHTESLDHGDAFDLADGRLIEVVAAEEPLLEVTGPRLGRIAWHVGNRHTPCQIEDARLLIQRDHVMRDMLRRLGAHVHEVTEPFTPEGGAYGHGRTHGHDHSHTHGPHVHDHGGDDPAHGHN